MKTVNDIIETMKTTNKTRLMGHIIGGYPTIETSIQAGLGICKGGADFLEVQFPFSDPFADGPTIENACYESLQNGFKVENGFEIIKKLSSRTNTAILAMTYANIIFKYGIKEFLTRAKESGASGLIIPDLPPEADEGLMEYAGEMDLTVILLITPGTGAERIQYLNSIGQGFLYTVARRGITGKKTEITGDVQEWFNFVKANTTLPIAAAFGINSNDQVKALKETAEIMVVGSHFVKTITGAVENKSDVEAVLKKATETLLGQ